ncbi:MAG: cytidylate kinase-like family protein [Acidimicrobiia bacterium]|nr:cytidylate kinase-like family protein [Acidimicrobiia bacterium]
MAVVTVTGDPGCRTEDAARLTAQRLGFDFISESALRQMVVEEFGAENLIPDRLYSTALTSILARLATGHHLVVCAPGVETLVGDFPGSLRVAVTAPENFRIGSLMLDHRLERLAALALLHQLEQEARTRRKKQFGRAAAQGSEFDLVVNAQSLASDHIAELLEASVRSRELIAQGLLSPPREAQLQFQVRLKLARHGITPAGKVSLERKPFANESEEIFANLLDFYRVAWEYEPRTFAIQWDQDGKVLESFTPDFYLPEFDLYVELTTMKQAHVTRKNRKVKLLKTIYPQINIQVFYQKDFRNLIFKYGLAERVRQS